MYHRHLNGSLPNRDIVSGFAFLIPQFISDRSNRCMEKETRSKRAKATSSFCLTLWLHWQCDYGPSGMCTWAVQPSCPDTWLHVAVWQVFGSVFLPGPSLDELLAGESKDNIRKAHWQYSGTYYGLDRQWITVPSSSSHDREENKYPVSPKHM